MPDAVSVFASARPLLFIEADTQCEIIIVIYPEINIQDVERCLNVLLEYLSSRF